MSGRMNWDRVRTENLSLLHGSEWVKPADDTLLGLAGKSAGNSKDKQKKRLRSGLKRKSRGLPKAVPFAKKMAGCTCGKSIGFTGQHKKACPLRTPEASTQPQVNADWVCPECHVILAGAKVPQPVAMEILLRHQRSSHRRISAQSTARTETPPLGGRVPLSESRGVPKFTNPPTLTFEEASRQRKITLESARIELDRKKSLLAASAGGAARGLVKNQRKKGRGNSSSGLDWHLNNDK